MSGTGKTTKFISSTADQTVNGVLSSIAWNDATVFYSAPTSSLEYLYSGEPSTFSPINAAMLAAADFALDTFFGGAADAGFSVEGFTNLNIEWTTNPNAHIRLANTNTSIPPSFPTTAWAYYPSTAPQGGDIWFFGDYSAPQAGNYHWHTILHEIGHALGLKHGHETNVYGALPFNEDSMEYSIMTYRSYVGAPLTGYTNGQWDFAQTYMMADIAALQHMYGADFTTNGDATVYSWTPGSGDTLVNGQLAIDAGGTKIFATIWDGGGVDTYDLSAYATGVTIDLNPGGFSIFSSAQLANLGPGQIASGNIYNALLFNGDLRSLIENALGGSGSDTIFLTSFASSNLVDGNGGSDTVWVSYNFGAGYTIQAGSTASNLVMLGAAGTDTLQDVEFVHFADGTTVSTASLITQAAVSVPYDFNNDDKSDILWYNPGSGQVTIWQMNGAQISSSQGVGVVGGAWQIAGTGDFNNDGNSDIVWYNPSNGQVTLWQMNGAQIVSSQGVGVVGGTWQVAGTGDFNNDGNSDILWYNPNNGQVTLWQMNGAQIVSSQGVGVVGGTWQVAGTGDFNNDDKSDILWYNPTSGQVTLWQMNGAQIVSSQGVGVVGGAWQVAGTGDYNGDGNSDILWHNSSNGQVTLWQMNGAQIVQSQGVGVVGGGWIIA